MVRTILSVAMTMAVAAGTAQAQLIEKTALTLQGAKQIAAAAESRANAEGERVVIAVVDDGGNLLLLERLDDPSYDVYVALLDNRPAGYGGLLQAGDIGRIENIFVAQNCRQQGVGRTLIAHLLALSKRLALRITCLQTQECNASAVSLYEECGLEVGGTYTEFVAPEANPRL